VRSYTNWLIRRYAYFHDVFFVDLLFHQFNMAIKGGAKVVVHSIQVVLDVHLIG